MPILKRYNATLLYVEDEDDIQNVYADFFERRFENVLLASDGEEGLKLFLEKKPDLVITDIRMPNLNGIEMITAIRKVDKKTPIILLSAYAEADFITDSVEDLVNAQISKPVNQKELDKALKELFESDYKEIKTAPSLSSNKNQNPEEKHESLPLMVVGIGASAGGLEALNSLVRGLPKESNTAYIIAQHLSPTHKTMLVDLLSRETELKVQDAFDGEKLAENTLYITPPNKNIEIDDNDCIKLSEPEKHSFLPKPSVNQLFISLAEHKKDKSFGIILSGTGSDGSQGMRAINAEGGITIVQDPSTAKYDGMPLASINGCNIDIVIDPSLIGEELVALANFPREKVLQKHQFSKSNDDLSTVFAMLYQYKKVDFSIYKRTTLLRRIERRMVAMKVTTLTEYIQKLQEDEKEVVQLYKDILIGVTSFFRDKEAFDSLKAILTKYLEDNSTIDEFRIWIPGTSTGEETYSIIITLSQVLETLNSHLPVRIFATDIDDDALKVARRGIYSEASISELSEDEIKQYFTFKENEFEVNKELRSDIVFSFHNLLTDPPFKNIDLLVCRNLLIYFTLDAQKHIMPLFHYALRDNGVLFLGKSENTTNYENLFGNLDKRNKIFKQIPTLKKEFTMLPKPPSYFQKKFIGAKLKEIVKETPVPLHERLVSEATKLLLPKVIITNEQMDIIYKKGKFEYINTPDGYVTINLYKMIEPKFAIELRSAINRAKNKNELEQTDLLILDKDEHDTNFLKIYIVPLLEERNPIYLLYFQEFSTKEIPHFVSHDEGLVKLDDQALELELKRTKEHMQTLIEELETSNEELQSTNEELETSNEELQSTNEELQTAYAELKELYQSNDAMKENYVALSKRYSTLLETMSDAVVVSTIDGVIIRSNKVMQELTGLSKEALLSRSWSEILGPEFAQNKHRIDQLLNTNKCEPFKVTMVSQQGKRRVLQVEEFLIDDDQGNKQVWSFLADITIEAEAKKALEVSEKKYKATFNHANIGIAHVAINGTWLSINDKLCNFLGYSEKDLKKLSFQQITYPDDLDKDIHYVKKLLKGEVDSYKMEKRYVRKDGTIVWGMLSAALVRNEEGNPDFFVSVIEDINSLKHTMLELDQAQVVFNATQESIMITDPDSVVIRVNKAFEKITGFSEKDVIGKPASFLRSDKHTHAFYQEMWHQIKKTGIWSGEIVNRNKNGDLYPAFLNINAVRDQEKRVVQYIGVLTDISLIKQSQEKVNYLANHDTLTSLPNRTLFLDRLNQALEKAKRHDLTLAVFFIDLDRFKVINDGLGHQVGDKVLVETANRFLNILRKEDTVARHGGDEFVVLIEGLETPISAGKIAQNIVDTLVQPIDTGDEKVQVGCSIGISIYPQDGITSEELLRQADIAMYEAKEAGRNTYRFTSEELSNNALEKVTLENSIRHGLENNEFEVHYQPIVDINTLEIEHLEALIRWNHPVLGRIMPGKFIPIAEESDLIVKITRYVMYDTIDAIKKLQEEYGCNCRVSINFSYRDFESTELFTLFKKYLTQSDVAANSIILELTERKFILKAQEQIQRLLRYEKMGVEFAIDDFGTGYSNLNYLSHFPLNYLKIDKSFVDHIGDDEKAEEIIRATIAISKAMEYKTIAEGVETKEQLEFLKVNGCDYAQGYLLAMPQNFENIQKYIREKKVTLD